ncbi:actin-like ATPase domain-containing protein [Colletotrichum eremochloae]|nr:actin-like ATPase domain-containing protein [Colletotrichum eremochloae]
MNNLCDGGLVGNREKNVFVIGIDFGTTFSGVSWAFLGQPDNIEVITRWESELIFNSDTEKTPSTLLYCGLQKEALWGYNIPAIKNETALKWFKLLLIDHKDLPNNLQESRQLATAKRLLEEVNREAVEAVSSYLRRLWNHSIECITHSVGKGLMRLCKFHVVITLPAIWPEYSKARMRRAVEDAGILQSRLAGDTVLSFISEPEAAALATMCDLKHRPDIQEGDHFVVCDAGGGTVDLISYQITEVSPVTVKESVKGNGKLCGGIFLDQAFIELMRCKVTPKVWDALSKDEVHSLLNSDWEHGIKQQFYGQQKDWIVTLPPGCCQAIGIGNLGLKQKLILTHADLDPDLIQEQVQQIRQKYHKMPKAVCIATTFSISPLTGRRSWSAICRGAVIQGLTRRNAVAGLSMGVKSRVARVSYGTVFYEEYDQKLHLDIDRTWNEEEMKWMASNQVHWYLKQGTDICDTESIRHNYYCLYEKPPSIVTERLYYSASWPTPGRKDSTVKHLCTIIWNKKVDFESLPTFTNPAGKVYYRLSYDIEMTCDGTSLDFTVFHDGKRVAAKNVS